jgi:tether containing UBX domain for GLUT4
MASHLVVVHTNARTVKIPTNPAKFLSEVRDEACAKFNVPADQFTLKYNNKPVSLSQQVRHANLPQGARVELIQSSRSPSVISVALQLPQSERNVRLTQKFANNTSLWEILRQFESAPGANYNFTQRGVPEMDSTGTSGAGRLNYEMPIITVMPGHREKSSFVGLQQTLGQLGFDNGSALLKLSFKNSGTPLEEAMGEISQYFKSSDAVPSGAHAATSVQSTSVPDPDKAAPEASEAVPETQAVEDLPEQMDVDSVSKSTEAQVTEANTTPVTVLAAAEPATASTPGQTENVASPPSRNIQVFAAPTSSTPQAARRAFNETDFEPTIEHAKIHQAALLAKTRNQRLLSDKELAEQESARLEKLKLTAERGGSIRIRMPDQTIVQVTISRADTSDSLYELVKGFLEFTDQPFLLKYIGSKGLPVTMKPGKERLIQDLGFSGREVVTFIWDENASADARLSRRTLKKEWQDQAQVLEVKEPVVEEKPEPAAESKSDGKRKVGGSSGNVDKESRLKSILGKGLFKR